MCSHHWDYNGNSHSEPPSHFNHFWHHLRPSLNLSDILRTSVMFSDVPEILPKPSDVLDNISRTLSDVLHTSDDHRTIPSLTSKYVMMCYYCPIISTLSHALRTCPTSSEIMSDYSSLLRTASHPFGLHRDTQFYFMYVSYVIRFVICISCLAPRPPMLFHIIFPTLYCIFTLLPIAVLVAR